MKLTFGYSPCPNDTFMFEAIVSKRIDLEGIEFEIHLADVEELNKSAAQGKYDITKLSFNAFTQLTSKYQLLNSGAALGKNCGPLLITRDDVDTTDLSKLKVAIPGVNTTANFLLNFAFPEIQERQEVLFSEIEDGVLNGKFDAGVIIHENRFTYKDKGLVLVQDLGEHWESTTNTPIPLGAIAVKRSFDEELKNKIDRIIARSIDFAFQNPEVGAEYIQCHAQEMKPEVMKAHIDLYVNEYSLHMNREGKSSVQYLFDHHPNVQVYTKPLFVPVEKPRKPDDALSKEFWSNRYRSDATGWDLGQVSPPLKSYIDQLKNKQLSILIPGAGNAHEAEYLYHQGFKNVHVLDHAAEPLKNLKNRIPDFPENQLHKEDFFKHEGQYDLILEQTFFCALHPELRSEYSRKMNELLNKGGKIVGLLFDIQFPFDGPPFGGSCEEYQTYFSPYFEFEPEECYNSIAPRQGNELFFIARKYS